MKKGLIILIIILVLIGGYFWITYNNLISMNEKVDNQWAQVETQYQRRFDLIPNLVASVQGAMKQEQKVFGDLANARTQYGSAKTVNDKAVAASNVESALSRLLVIMEAYPELKSIATVQTLMAQLEGTENRISVERKRFNDLSRDFNITIKRIPANWIAGMLGFSEKQYFQAASGAENAPAVNL